MSTEVRIIINTYIEKGSATSPNDKLMVSKPIIYYSLKKLNSYYRKQIKKGLIEPAEAYRKLGSYFDIGFAIYAQDTNHLENALKDTKKPDQIDAVFAMVVLEKAIKKGCRLPAALPDVMFYQPLKPPTRI